MSNIYKWLFGPPAIPVDAHETDPTLLKENSTFKTYTTSRCEYKDVRVFFRQHVKAAQLPKDPGPLPLLVCIPGLGGSVAQFHPLLSSLVDMAPCLAIDHPGGGRSAYSQTRWGAYTMEALAELLETIIEDHRDKDAGQKVVLIGHSLGTGLSALLASKKTTHTTDLVSHIVGLIAICPSAGPLGESSSRGLRALLWVPGWVFSLWRLWDSRGGPNSVSIARFAGAKASPELRLLQYRFNQQSRTPVFRRMAGAAAPPYRNGKPQGGLPTTDIWGELDIPLYLIGGEADKVTPTANVDKIVNAIKTKQAAQDGADTPIEHVSKAAEPVGARLQPDDHDLSRSIVNITEEDFEAARSGIDSDESPNDDYLSTPLESPTAIPAQPEHPAMVVQSIIIPAPANHTLLYAPRGSRILAGLIADFLATHITGRLSLAWQLQYLSQEGKWDVKNLAKWQSVLPVSAPIGPPSSDPDDSDDGVVPIFRALKTLREADDVHSPAAFTARWGEIVKDVVDISRDQPVYDARGLERAGVHYHKFPTVSKVPPAADEVAAFIRLVDSIRARQADRAIAEGWAPDWRRRVVVGVHCHYGYNRTGFLVVCYLVERCGVPVQDAIAAFKKAKPNGIRHSHFLDKLYVRYDLDAKETGN
ncbi:dual specificity phosphatase catalytic domain protein [Cordyceps fumosorosea ARSEF 2679]|uniref:Dual specificity phosphatase catalytic domain protein n=1 Tax=Cordyceps fumosorosea (strain ARSEF 2679) TaxID=1081104 RepID=A0A167Q1R1_CORFA|nr:dual specificity phosphatase catalytic domain protein [Cordyceps fumosorosea ARSEF 2679]OAA57205.1 dual specificity phosphatase catalytic domain protein [Cordyceps fumosorosea ARSEF 2679]